MKAAFVSTIRQHDSPARFASTIRQHYSPASVASRHSNSTRQPFSSVGETPAHSRNLRNVPDANRVDFLLLFELARQSVDWAIGTLHISSIRVAKLPNNASNGPVQSIACPRFYPQVLDEFAAG
ncbi:MAG: hypothetical protein ACI9HK_001613, partial [Pirellulaceae bacterium]